MDNETALILNGSLGRIAEALEKANEINKNQLRYAIDRDRVTLEFMERREKREIDNTKANLIIGGDNG